MREGAVTFSLVKLQRLAASFEELADGRPRDVAAERLAKGLASGLGATAIPLCLRELSGRDQARAQWAASLLEHVAEHGHRARVVNALQARGGERAGALIDRIGASAGEDVSMAGLTLAGLTAEPSEIARTADSMLHNLDPLDLYQLLEGLADKDPAAAECLLDEILLRTDIDERFRAALRELRAPLVFREPREPRAKPTRALTRTRLTLYRGAREDGRRVLLGWRRIPGSRPPRWRGLCCLIDEEGRLIDALHRDDFTARGVQREIIEPLRREGFTFRVATRGELTGELIDAARAMQLAGAPLPRDFYVGRDLLGLVAEHLLAPRLASPAGEADLHALLARAVELLRATQIEQARPLLERYVAEASDDSEGRAHLGLCLLELGELRAARPHLTRAAWLAPSESLHHWNLAALSHREGRLGGCYLSLLDYRRHPDVVDPDAAQRARTAAAFTAEYERLARLEYPDTSARKVARADELLCAARAEPDLDHRIEILRRAVRTASSQYRAWTALGIAYADKKRLADAQRCLDRALRLRPDFPEAAAALSMVVELRDMATARKARSRTRAREARKRTAATTSSKQTRSR